MALQAFEQILQLPSACWLPVHPLWMFSTCRFPWLTANYALRAVVGPFTPDSKEAMNRIIDTMAEPSTSNYQAHAPVQTKLYTVDT